MNRVLSLMRDVVQHELSARRAAQLGVVTETFPHDDDKDSNNYEANVKLKYEGLELQRVPLAVAFVGVARPPRIGDLVLVEFINGDLNQPVVTGRFYTEGNRPPVHRDGEFIIEQRNSDGKATATIRIDGASGDIEILAGDGVRIQLTAADNSIVLKGNVTIMGDLKVSSGTQSTTISGHTITGS